MRWDSQWKRIVFVPMDRIGDAVSDTPALDLLHSLNIDVVVLATPYTEQIFMHNPHVHKVVSYTRARRDGFFTAILSNRRTVREIAALRPDAILGMMRPIRELRYIYTALRIPVLGRPQDPSLSIHMRWVNFFRQLGIEAQPAQNEVYTDSYDHAEVERWLKIHTIDKDSPLLVVQPGCSVYRSENVLSESLRYWQRDNYIELFSSLPENIQIILTGISPREIEENIKLKSLSPRLTEVFDIKNIRALYTLICRSDVLLTLDTGALHIGAATHTPIVALFGPTTPSKYGPFRDNITYITAADSLPCWPCDHNAVCSGNNVCMKGITPQVVAQALSCAFNESTRNRVLFETYH